MRYSKLSDDIEFLMQEESGSRKQNTKHIKYQYKYKYKYKYKYRNKYKYKILNDKRKKGALDIGQRQKGQKQTQTFTNIH